MRTALVALISVQGAACSSDPSVPSGECADGASQPLACGLNGLGTQTRTCTAGVWSPPGPCMDPDQCLAGASESVACGLNDRGTQTRACPTGSWSSPGPCVDPDVCVDTASESVACGLNDRGAQTRTCTIGAWSTTGTCVDPDVCVDGASQSFVCGLNNDGAQAQSCVMGAWSAPGPCNDPDVCVNGAAQSVVCGLNGQGAQAQICAMGAWSAPGPCADPDVCVNGASQSLVCGFNGHGAQAQICAAGAWGAPSACVDPDVCLTGASESLACGLNSQGAQTRSCVMGAWGAPSACVDPDVCVNGATASLACGFNGQGAEAQTCVMGAWTTSGCADPDACVNGAVDQTACGILGSHSRQCALGQWSAYSACNAPAFLSIPAPGRRDMVHDAKRHRLYITTSTQVLSYDLAAQSFDAPLLSGGPFLGIDLSPDESHVVVADQTTAGGQSWIHVLDLVNGTSQKILFTLSSLESGTYTTVFTSNTEALVTSNFAGSGWVPMRRIDLTNGTSQKIASVNQGTMLTLSADGTTVAYAESNISSGAWGRYDVNKHTFANSGGTNWFVYEIAVSRTATQYAVPTYGGLYVYDGGLALKTKIGVYANNYPVGVVYSPLLDEMYLAWTGAATSIDVYSTTTLQKVRDIAPGPGLFGSNGNGAFVSGRMRVSRDGTIVFATSGSSVLAYPTGP